MKLIQLQKYDLPQYASILPDSILHCPGEIFVCTENKLPCGAIVLEKLGNHLGINWLFIVPGMRRRKLGSALLKKACLFAKQHSFTALTITYDPDEPWTAILEYMLAKIGFRLLMFPFTRYRITPDVLLASPLIHNFPMPKEGRRYTQAFADLSPQILTKLLFQCQKNHDLLLSRSNFSNADPQKTRFIYDGNKLKGLTLVHSTNTPGEYELALVYLNPAHLATGPALFRETAYELLKDSNGFSALQFTCVVHSAVRLADALFGKAEKNRKQICHGILEMSIPEQTERRSPDGTDQ